MLLGIDVSHYSGTRDWRGLAQAGIGFAFIKATEGSTVRDDLFAHHWRGMHDAGVPCGAYHYAHPGSNPATQAAHFHGVVGDLGPNDLQPVLDLEVGDGHPATQVVDWVLTFMAKAESLFGARLIIYTGGFWRNQLGNPPCPGLSARKLWTARYGGRPVLPAPWEKWSIWQFSDGIHRAPPEAAALKCNCDWNRLAEGLDLKDLTVAANPVRKSDGVGQPQGTWPGRFFAFPATPQISGADVRQWQAQMRARGWSLEPDGDYGPASRTACISLQREEGLEPDGIVGPKTWAATFAS